MPSRSTPPPVTAPAPVRPAAHPHDRQPRPRVTQIDVARAAGVHSTTVSQALRNNPTISPATRARIHELARTMGYSPDPVLTALVAYRRGVKRPRRVETIGYVTASDTRWGWRRHLPDELAFQGARERALASGYQLEHFWLGEPGMTPRHLSRMLYHRGIAGVLLGPMPRVAALPLDLDWEHLAAVRIGPPLPGPGLHRVAHDPTGDVRAAVRRAVRAGCRRIGLVVAGADDAGTGRCHAIGFAIEQQRLPAASRLPVLHLAAGAAPETLAGWRLAHRPDVILGAYPLFGDALARAGIRVPGDVACIDLHPGFATPGVAGIRADFSSIGRIAVELLSRQLQNNQRGLPDCCTTTLVEGSWSDGASFPTPRLHPAIEPDHLITDHDLQTAVGL